MIWLLRAIEIAGALLDLGTRIQKLGHGKVKRRIEAKKAKAAKKEK